MKRVWLCVPVPWTRVDLLWIWPTVAATSFGQLKVTLILNNLLFDPACFPAPRQRASGKCSTLMHAQKLKWFDILNEKSGETQEIGSPLLFLMNKNLRPIPHNSSKTPSQLEPQDVHHSNQLNYAPTRFYCLLSLLGIPYYNKPLPTQCAPALLSEENADVLTCTKYLAETHANPHKSSPPRFYTVIMLYRFDLLLNLVPIQTIHRFKGAHKSCYNKASKLVGGGGFKQLKQVLKQFQAVRSLRSRCQSSPAPCRTLRRILPSLWLLGQLATLSLPGPTSVTPAFCLQLHTVASPGLHLCLCPNASPPAHNRLHPTRMTSS